MERVEVRVKSANVIETPLFQTHGNFKTQTEKKHGEPDVSMSHFLFL